MRLLLFTILCSLMACHEPVSDKYEKSKDESNNIASVKLADLDGQPISMDQFKGKTVFLNFWATWCKPCIQEMPSIDSTQRLLSKNGVVFLLASDETPEQIKEFKEHYQLDLNFVRVTNMEELSMVGLPTTYIYNPNGENVFAEMGYRKWNDSTNIEMILKINNQK